MDKKLAQLQIPGADAPIQAPEGVPTGGAGTLSSAIAVGINIFLIVVIIAALFFIMWAGIRWIQSNGDAQKIESARTQIIFAIIGLLVALFAFAFINFFGSIFGVNLI